MKLLDPGTIIDNNVTEKKFAGNPAKVVKVTYDDEVGSDTCYFYFNPSSFALMGYQFFHDEDKGDGEYIVLAGLEEVNNIKIPKSRT